MIMAVASSSTTTSLEAMDATPPVSTSEAAATDMSSSAPVSCANGASDLCDPSNSSREARRDGEIQNAASLRSEEYRQLFRLPPEEVLVEDFNCACQENILVQGHMYLFVHYICFYSNIFGFETKKIIHFRDITSVKRAKTAGIFPNAIEIVAGGKKYFFASFLSRDEAFKLINDGWMQHGSDSRAVMDKQECLSESSFLENGSESDSVRSSKRFDDMEISDRSENVPVSIDLVVSHTEDDNAAATLPDLGENEEHNAEPTLISGYPSSAAIWKVEDYDAPKVQECQTKVAESKFPVKVEEFFNLFFSDNAVEFLESFHRRCGDKEFKCSPWRLDDQFGHTREVSFQHPIKIYFGARFGSCQEMQKFRVYRNSHLVVEKSQEINDVPYGDYFRVEGLWDVRRGGDKLEEQCCLSVYVNVAFVKKTMFKGKIVQSTLEECREAYAIWVDMAHELLKERNLEKREKSPQSNMIQNGEVSLEANQDTGHPVQESSEPDNSRRMPKMLDPMDADKHEASLFPGNWINGVSVSLSPMIRETLVRSWGRMKSQTHLPQLVAITFAVILLMQFSIVLLLTRPQNIQIISQADYIGGSGSGVGEKSSEAIAWLEKRLYHLKDEMSMVESRLERMRWEHAQLKEQLRDLEHFHNHGK